MWVVLLTLMLTSTAVAQNRALKLDGKGSYVELPPDIFTALTQATVEVWAKWAEFGAYSRVFEFGAGYQSVSLFNHLNSADLRFNIYPRYARNDPGSMFTARANGLLRTNEWMHLAAVSGAGGMKLYANGRLVAQHTNTTTFADIDVTFTNLLGRGLAKGPLDQDFRGEMDEVRVWDHARSLDQIRDAMFKRLTGKEEGLKHLWNFDDGTARDAVAAFGNGTLKGKAKVVSTDLDLAVATMPTAAVAEVPNSNALPVNGAVFPSTAPIASNDANAAVWWIAGSLVALVGLLAWLVFLLRRSGLGSARVNAGPPTPSLDSGTGQLIGGAAGARDDKEIKERALADLTDFAKQSLVQGLYSQRAALLEVHKKAQHELAELEARVVALHLPERIQAYEKRIEELETQLATRGDELRELTHATLEVLRRKLAEEKQKQDKPNRFNSLL